MLLHVPPLPSVMVLPPPLKFPVPAAHTKVVLPCTALFGAAPYTTLKVGLEPPLLVSPVKAPRATTPVLLSVVPATPRPLPKVKAPLAPPIEVTTVAGRPCTWL